MVQFFVHTAAAEPVQSDGAPQTAADMKMPETCIQMGREIMLSSRETGHFYQPGAPGSEQHNSLQFRRILYVGAGIWSRSSESGLLSVRRRAHDGIRHADGSPAVRRWPGERCGEQERRPGSAIRLKLTLLIAAALIAIAVMLYLLFFKAGTPEDTVQKMEDALNRMDQQGSSRMF